MIFYKVMFKTLNPGDDFFVVCMCVCVKAAEISLAFWAETAVSVLLYLTPTSQMMYLTLRGNEALTWLVISWQLGKNYFPTVFLTYSSTLTFDHPLVRCCDHIIHSRCRIASLMQGNSEQPEEPFEEGTPYHLKAEFICISFSLAFQFREPFWCKRGSWVLF